MSRASFGWEALLHTDASPECRLKGALFTTYERADTRFLAEHLLPLFLKLERDPESEGRERDYYLLELDRRLKQLHNKIVVVSSVVREEPADAAEVADGEYDWLWHLIRNLTVGRHGRVVQHAKLWMLHWRAPGAAEAEYLELVVSSANLTMSAFKGQIQGVWRVCLPLKPGSSKSRSDRWGVLPDFLRELAKSAGDEKQLAPFTELLARAECPKKITFVASVPGTFTKKELRRTPWGVAGLRIILPQRHPNRWMSIFCPYIGIWSAEKLRRWCAYIGVSTETSELVWIGKDHSWAKKWILPSATLLALEDAKVELHHFKGNDVINDEHHIDEDGRWSHAKIYMFRGGTSHLLITSANFSQSAWGSIDDNGGITIKNFELGVHVEQGVWPFDGLDEFTKIKSIATVEQLPVSEDGSGLWGQAVWDGKAVAIVCRCAGNQPMMGCIGDKTVIDNWIEEADGCRSASVVWVDAEHPPLSVRLTCAQNSIQVAVFDERPMDEIENSVALAADGDLVQSMRDELLFEEYGGSISDEDSLAADAAIAVGATPEPAKDQNMSPGESAPADSGEIIEDGIQADSYAVPVFELTRRYYDIVDNWSAKTKQAVVLFERQALKRDGEMLAAAFKRQGERDAKKEAGLALAAKLAGEEMGVRLKHVQEE